MIFWLLQKFENKKKERARGSAPVFPIMGLKYTYHYGGRYTEIRFRATGRLHMVLWDVDDDLDVIAKHAFIPPAQLLAGVPLDPLPGNRQVGSSEL